MTMAPAVAFDVLGCGAVAVDDLLYVEGYPPAESKVRVLHRQRQCGGLTGTALVAAARLGARCAYVGRLGDDELSLYVIDHLTREGIDLSFRAACPDARPAHSTIIVDQQHQTRTIFASLDSAIGPDPHWPHAELIQDSRVLLIDHHGLPGTLRATRIAREAGVAVVADLERDPGPPFAEILALVDHLVISAAFAEKLTSAADPARAAERLWHTDRQAVVVTCGADGCWYTNGAAARQAQHCPALPVDVVDTTGCGDVFHGAYSAALARGETLSRRVVLASAAAAVKATQRGGQAGCPSLQQVEDLLAERGLGD